MFVFNLVAQTSGAVVGTTVAKMFVLVEGAALGVCIAIWFVSSLILVYATILQATTVVQGKFVPLSVGTKIAVNAITGEFDYACGHFRKCIPKRDLIPTIYI